MKVVMGRVWGQRNWKHLGMGGVEGFKEANE